MADLTNFTFLFYLQIHLIQDVNKNGHIMYTEFLAATLEAHGYIAEDKIAEAFNILDRYEMNDTT